MLPPGAPGQVDRAPTRAPRTPPPRASGRAGGGAPSTDAAPEEAPPQDLSTAWSYSTEDAPEPLYVKTGTESALSVNPIGFYQGVSVGGGNLPPYVAAELGAMPAVMTWTGFERTQASSRVFFQLSSDVPYEVSSQGNLISLRLPNTSPSVRNNIRRLDTRYFRTPVTEVTMRRSGADMVISISLRREAAPEVAMMEGENGYRILIIDFPDTDAERLAPTVE